MTSGPKEVEAFRGRWCEDMDATTYTHRSPSSIPHTSRLAPANQTDTIIVVKFRWWSQECLQIKITIQVVVQSISLPLAAPKPLSELEIGLRVGLV
jgi:hypothetical protein